MSTRAKPHFSPAAKKQYLAKIEEFLSSIYVINDRHPFSASKVTLIDEIQWTYKDGPINTGTLLGPNDIPRNRYEVGYARIFYGKLYPMPKCSFC
jgi:hypothetical protein